MIGRESRYQTRFQRQPADLPRQTWDVVIIGAGPAGSACARTLAGKGHAVLLVDKECYPRHKVCGDLLVPDSLGMLRHLGAWDRIARIAHHSRAIEVASPSGIQFSVPGEYLTLSRIRLDYELYQHAVESGAVSVQGNVVDVEPSADSSPAAIRLSDSDRSLSARFVVLATGAVVDLAHRVGLVGDSNLDPSAIGMRCYVRSPHRREDTIISYDESILPGYGWIVPLGEDRKHPGSYLYNVGCGTMYRHTEEGRHHLKKTLRLFMEAFAPAREVMQGAEIIPPTAGASLRCGLPRNSSPVRGNVLAIGETIGATYPFTGEGIGKAMETGAMAAEILHEALIGDNPSHLSYFAKRLQKLRPRYKGYAKAEKYLGSCRVNDYMAQRITRSRYLQRRVEAFMAETESPRLLFNPLSIVISYFS